MLRVILLLVALFTYHQVIALESNCPRHTPEQESIIYNAYYSGLPYNLGYTLAAIAWQESFVWKYVVKVNPKDGEYGSYGVTHVTLEYAMEVFQYSSPWKAKQDLVPMMINSDNFTFNLSLKKLMRYNSLKWRAMVKRYNGTGEAAEKYADSVSEKVKLLKQCYTFGGL